MVIGTIISAAVGATTAAVKGISGAVKKSKAKKAAAKEQTVGNALGGGNKPQEPNNKEVIMQNARMKIQSGEDPVRIAGYLKTTLGWSENQAMNWVDRTQASGIQQGQGMGATAPGLDYRG